MDMMVEQMEKDSAYRERILQTNRWLPEHVRQMSTEEIIAKLQTFGVPFDPQTFRERDVQRFRSAEALSDSWWDVYKIMTTGLDDDFIFIAAIVLWERLAPDIVNVEMLDDWMQEGYKLIEAEPKPKTAEACQIWLRVWDHFKTWLTPEMTTVEQADELFSGMQSFSNWCQELEAELHNAGLDDPRFFHERLRYCQEFCRQFHEDEGMIPSFLRAEAETYFSLGQESDGVRKFEQLIERFPDWAWGYVGWGDEYWIMKDSVKDYARADQIYRKALERPALEDRDMIYDRLAQMYDEMGNPEKAKRYAQLAAETRESARPVIPLPPLIPPPPTFSTKPKKSQPPPKPVVSRNQPCPCGSGKKYKRCCGR
jgi:tetratricopeptide (TPR) repeat protein